MLKYCEANPLAVFGLREMDHRPPHFVPVEFEIRTHDKMIKDWIWTNLEGRFYYGDWYSKTSAGGVDCSKCAAFELAGEASMFALILDTINRNEMFLI